MKKTLLIIGHYDISKSVFNKQMINAVQDLPNVKIHYIEDNFNVEEEQALLLQYDKIILQFPFLWYAAPARLKNWLDTVWSFGFAFGTNYKLEGKKGTIAITTAGAEEFYKHEGYNKYTIEELTRPFERTFEYCKMTYQKPCFVIHFAKPNIGISQEELEKKLIEYKKFVQSF